MPSSCGRLPLVAVTAFGAMECIGALGEPVTFQALAPSTFDPVLAITQLGMIFLPLATASFGFVAWRSSREAASTAAPPRV